MSFHQKRAALVARTEVVAAPAIRGCQDQSFELPLVLHGAIAAMFFGFVTIMAIGFADPGMVVPVGIIVVFLTAFFGVPVAIVKTTPGNVSHSLGWREFMANGIVTATGRCPGREAAMLVLLLPALILLWAAAVVTIAALV